MRSLPKTQQVGGLSAAGTYLLCGLFSSLILAPATATADSGSERSVLVFSRKSDRSGISYTATPAGDARKAPVDPNRLEPIPAGTESSPSPALAHLDDEPTLAILEKNDAEGESESADAIVAHASHFHGIQPGTTTIEGLLASWGAPMTESSTGTEPGTGTETGEDDGESNERIGSRFRKFVYKIEPFRRIEVHAEDNVVKRIQIELVKPLAPSLLAKQLDLSDIHTAIVRDRKGEALGISFPERGVLMTLVPENGRPRVSLVLLETLDAEPFILRAESKLHGPYTDNLRDLRFALQLEPKLAKAKWLLAEIYLATGQPTRAEAVAEAAVALEPDNHSYRLRHMRAMAALGRHEGAIEESKRILMSDPPPLVKAQTLAQVASLAALGSEEDARNAVSLWNKAIQSADRLATSRDQDLRHTAKDLLVDCHLAIAEQIARGDWQKKATVVPKWIGRASSFAEEMIESDGGSLELRLRTAGHALAALSEFQPMPDPTDWIDEAQDAAAELLDQSDDVMWQRRVHWQLGMAYFHALHIAHVRGSADEALEFGRNAVKHLGQGARSREALPANEHLVGRLYFRIGAVHAIHRQEHAKAVVWYEKAVPMLSQPVPVSQHANPRRHGDALISMGVSFWRVGQPDRGLELTDLGADILVEAERNGLVEPNALTVAYNNLATMHKKLGNNLEAEQYERLARGEKNGDSSEVRR